MAFIYGLVSIMEQKKKLARLLMILNGSTAIYTICFNVISFHHIFLSLMLISIRCVFVVVVEDLSNDSFMRLLVLSSSWFKYLGGWSLVGYWLKLTSKIDRPYWSLLSRVWLKSMLAMEDNVKKERKSGSWVISLTKN